MGMGVGYGILGVSICIIWIACKCLAPTLTNIHRQKLPPGSMGWPLIGDNLRWYFSLSRSNPRAFVQHRTPPQGGIFKCNLAGNPTVVSVDPSFNKFVLQNEGKLFQSLYPKSFRDLIGKYGLLAIHGDLHRKLHALAVNLIGSHYLRGPFFTDIQNLLQKAVAEWEGKDIFLQHECKKMTTNLMTKQLFSIASDEIAAYCSDFEDAFVSIPIKIPGSAHAKGMKARSVLINKIYEMIEERRKDPKIAVNDLLLQLLNEKSLSDEMVADFMITMLFAAYETVSKAMTLVTYFLTHCPKALEELRMEHDQLSKTRGVDQKLSWNDYKSMKFTQCVINESRRLTSIPIAHFRKTVDDINFKDYIIPKGWTVLPFMSAVHLSEDLYSDPFKFDPWRWQELARGNPNNNNILSFAPFGGGPRMCPGADFARLVLSLFLHHFVTKMRWEQLKEDKISYFPIAYMVGGFNIRVLQR